MTGRIILCLFEGGIFFICIIFIVSFFDEIERACSENSIEFFFYKWMIILVKYSFEYLRNKIDHSLKEVLIFEYQFTFTMAQQDSHIYITDFLAFLL